MSFMPLLALLFIGLKLTNYIDWSWWWVTAPLYVPAIIAILALIGGLVAGGKLRVRSRK
jgi:uncharacterized membrane protein